MKELWIVLAVLLVGFAALVIWVSGICGYHPALANNFATKAHLKYHYDSKVIDVDITDPKDVKALKSILTGYVTTEMTAGGYFETVTITLSDGRKNVTFEPALDGDSRFGIGASEKYLVVTDKKRKAFDAIWRRYGLVFP